jgi:hypothetical protein
MLYYTFLFSEAKSFHFDGKITSSFNDSRKTKYIYLKNRALGRQIQK